VSRRSRLVDLSLPSDAAGADPGASRAWYRRLAVSASLPLLPTTVVGSYPQPEWLIDRGVLLGSTVARVGLPKLWRVADAVRETAEDDAVRLVLRDMERAGIDIVSDGEVRRESYFNWLAPRLTGIDLEKPGTAIGRTGKPTSVPRIVGEITRPASVLAKSTAFVRAETERPFKITIPGPFTLTALAQDEYYKDPRALAMAFAGVVNQELRDLKAAGADFVQLDEPYLQAWPDRAREYGVAVIDRALDGIPGPTVIHLCFGYAHTVKEKPSGYSFLPELERCRATHVSIEAAQPRLDTAILQQLFSKTIVTGVLDLGDEAVEKPHTVANRIRGVLAHVPPERVVLAPDCGMKYLPRERALGKLQAMVAAARQVRTELGSR
jgi:5-methyltetrahydropteroyltriglutamate--homocysteine methyltransferase